MLNDIFFAVTISGVRIIYYGSFNKTELQPNYII